MNDWEEFEIAVANGFRGLDANVRRNVPLAGNQIDIVVEERTRSNQLLRIAVECKSHERPVGIHAVNEFGIVTQMLIQAGLIDKSIIVARNGFTTSARYAADHHKNLSLMEFEELTHRQLSTEAPGSPTAVDRPTQGPVKTAFVAMPFAEEFYDVYVLGIAAACGVAGFSAVRVDELEYGGSVDAQIQDEIKKSSIVIAEISIHNPNVFYEVGFSHALKKDVIFLCRAGQEGIPFDVAHYRCIFYKNIVDLKEKLVAFLRSR
jgi:restriction endonuclease